MQYHKLGNTDIEVSVICLGTMTWGEQNTRAEAFEQMDYAFAQGVNFYDTAELYPIPPRSGTYGHTEEIIGEPVHENRASGGSDARFLCAAGVQTICARPIVGNLHAHDEWIDIQSMATFYRIAREYVMRSLLKDVH